MESWVWHLGWIALGLGIALYISQPAGTLRPSGVAGGCFFAGLIVLGVIPVERVPISPEAVLGSWALLFAGALWRQWLAPD